MMPAGCTDMDAQQVAVPAIPGIDLAFRPRTYFGPMPAEMHLLAHTTGHERREVLRAQLASDGDDPILDLLADLFEGLDRESLGRIHPALMGGEFLPPFLDDETEIARISLASTTADQISVRAQRLADGIAYRIVDEYEDMSPDYVCQPGRSELPVTLGELIGLIDGARGGRSRWGLICGAGSCNRLTSACGTTRYGLKAPVIGVRLSAGPMISHSAWRAATSSRVALYRALTQRPSQRVAVAEGEEFERHGRWTVTSSVFHAPRETISPIVRNAERSPIVRERCERSRLLDP